MRGTECVHKPRSASLGRCGVPPQKGVAGDAHRLPLRGMPSPHATCKCQIFRGPRSGSKTNYCCISPSRIVLFSR